MSPERRAEIKRQILAGKSCVDRDDAWDLIVDLEKSTDALRTLVAALRDPVPVAIWPKALSPALARAEAVLCAQKT